jgi:hypothetical protein
MPKTIETVERELEDARARCLQAERDGAELAQRYQGLVDVKDAEIVRLKKDNRGGVIDCAGCDRLRLIQMITATVAVFFWWCTVFAESPLDVDTKRHALLCVMFPAMEYWLRKKGREFKKRVAWRGVRDNDIYRRYQTRWNNTLDRFHMR